MRFAELTEGNLTEAQREIYREICKGPRGRVGPPSNVLLRCPGFAKHSTKLGEYVRYGSSLPSRISEFLILITARYWTAQYEWYEHHPLAIKAGLSVEVASELANGKRPSGMKDDEAAAYQFCTELHRNKEVSDEAFNVALQHFGEAGVVELIGVSGYYTLVSMILKVNKNALPPGTPPPLPAID